MTTSERNNAAEEKAELPTKASLREIAEGLGIRCDNKSKRSLRIAIARHAA